MKGKWVLLAGIALFAGAGAGAISYWRREQVKPVETAAPAAPVAGAEVLLPGKLRAQSVLGISAPIEGTVAEIPVRPGEDVAEGQLIALIHNTRLEEERRESEFQLESANDKKNAAESAVIAARLEESRASADASRARSEYTRIEKIYQRQALLNREGATPRRVYEAAERDFETVRKETETLDAKVEQVRRRIEDLVREAEAARQVVAEKEAELEESRTALRSAEVHSPVTGVIVAILKQPGDEILKSSPQLFEIAADLTLLEAVLEPEPAILKRLQPGQAASIQIAELAGDGLPAKITSVAEGQAIVQFASPSPLIRPGLTALVKLKLL